MKTYYILSFVLGLLLLVKGALELQLILNPPQQLHQLNQANQYEY